MYASTCNSDKTGELCIDSLFSPLVRTPEKKVPERESWRFLFGVDIDLAGCRYHVCSP